jgi:hypothetical protein
MQLYDANDAFNTFKMLLLNDRVSNQLTDSEKQQLVNLVKQCERKHRLVYLMIEFAKTYNIYLHFIAFVKDKFMIINEYSFVGDNKSKKQAFIVLNGDYTVCGPLFVLFRKQAIFTIYLKSIKTNTFTMT